MHQAAIQFCHVHILHVMLLLRTWKSVRKRKLKADFHWRKANNLPVKSVSFIYRVTRVLRRAFQLILTDLETVRKESICKQWGCCVRWKQWRLKDNGESPAHRTISPHPVYSPDWELPCWTDRVKVFASCRPTLESCHRMTSWSCRQGPFLSPLSISMIYDCPSFPCYFYSHAKNILRHLT